VDNSMAEETSTQPTATIPYDPENVQPVVEKPVVEIEKSQLQKAVDIFNSLLDSYASSILKSSIIEESLLKKEAILKSIALLGKLEFRNIRRDINAWEIVLKKLETGFKNIRNLKKIKQMMQEKIQTAERVMLEAQKMR
jgi:hypothetical protein